MRAYDIPLHGPLNSPVLPIFPLQNSKQSHCYFQSLAKCNSNLHSFLKEMVLDNEHAQVKHRRVDGIFPKDTQHVHRDESGKGTVCVWSSQYQELESSP